MPVTITIPGQDFYDAVSGRFIITKEITVTLEHSLLSVSKWEAKWHKPYLSTKSKTPEESIDYIRCMCTTKGVDPRVFNALTNANIKMIMDYIQDPMTATTIRRINQKPSNRIVTSEVIYFWMANFQIPFEPCEKWHLNRLMTLIEVASAENQPKKKMGKKEAAKERAALNAQRRARYNTKG